MKPLVLGLLFVFGFAYGQKPGTMGFNGVGTHSCGVYLANRNGLQRDTYSMLYQQWGAGFAAGVSNQGKVNPVADLETYTAWLDKWCTDDPASSVVQGVIALSKRLAPR